MSGPSNIPGNQSQSFRRVGPYELHNLLGRGGMAEVFRAYQPSLDRYVALKLVHSGGSNDPHYVERFQREARSAAQLVHPNIVQIYDFGEDAGTYYIAMELIEGQTLLDEIRQGQLTFQRVFFIMEQIGAALEKAHSRNILHRDIKSSNILLSGSERAVLSDFGIAKALDANTSLTKTGNSVGTLSYMAPEQLRGEPSDKRSDQYSLAVVLYEMLTGRLPFQGSLYELPFMVVQNLPPSPSQLNPDLTPAIEAVIMRGLAKQPQERFNSVTDLVRAFGQALATAPTGPQSATVMLNKNNLTRPVGPATYTQPLPDFTSDFNTAAASPSPVRPVSQPSSPLDAPVGRADRSSNMVGFFGYKGLPGMLPVPQGVVGELPPPLRKPSRGWLVGAVAVLLIVSLAIAGLILGLRLPGATSAEGKLYTNQTAQAGSQATANIINVTGAAVSTQNLLLRSCAQRTGGTWSDLANSSGVAGLHQGEGVATCLSGLSNSSNFVLELDVTIQSRDPITATNYAGIYFRAKDDPAQGAYYLSLATNGVAGAAFLGKNDLNSKNEELKRYPEAKNEAIPLRRDVPNHLKLEVSGNTIKVYLNYEDRPIIEKDDATHSDGRFGFYVLGTSAEFRNLKFSAIG